MLDLIKPKALKRGEKVAAVSLSWGAAGDKDKIWRYEQGKRRLEEELGLQVVEMDNALKGSRYLYDNPEKRAEDLMNAFKDESIKGIFTCVGGTDSIRLLPYIDFEVIKRNPKVFIGYSDTTISHMMCLKAGLSSFYGPAILLEFAENVEMLDYTKYWVKKALFDNSPIGNIESSEVWTSEFQPWEESCRSIARKTYKNEGYELLQGKGKVTGNLMGGCIDMLDMVKGTELWPDKEQWKDSILFFEVSEDKLKPVYLECCLRNYAMQGILQEAKGIIFGKPYDNEYYEEYKRVILKVVRRELKLENLPIIFNVNFGHTSPMITMPYGAMAEIDCDKVAFSILEAGVL